MTSAQVDEISLTACQKSFSGLHLPRQSYKTYSWRDSWIQTIGYVAIIETALSPNNDKHLISPYSIIT